MSRCGCLLASAALLFVAACGEDEVVEVTTIAVPDSTLATSSVATEFAVDTLARDLVVPWGVAVAPDGRIFVTERRGRILVLAPSGAAPTEWARVAVHAEDPSWGPESGLTGLAFAPDFSISGELFVMATVRRDGPAGRPATSRLARWRRRLASSRDPAAALEFETRILRLTERDGRGVEPSVIVQGVPANHYHAGGALAFGPDGMLYAGFGDAQVTAFPRDTSVLAGKLIRIDRQGRVPQDNPISGSPVYAMGLRNPQAITWLSDGTMLVADHGPTGMPHEGGRAGRDELNVVTPGADFGWPVTSGWESAPGLRAPLWVWREAIAPAGLAAWEGSVLVGSLKGGIERVELASGTTGLRAVSRERTLDGVFGRVRTIVAEPDGALLVTTSNRDARGIARPGDDLLLRLRPLP